MFELLAKNILSLFALVDPIGLLPLFVAAISGVSVAQARRFALQLSATVAVALSVAGLFGVKLLALLGLSIGGMQVGGGLIALSVALTTVLGHQSPEREKAAGSAAAPKMGLVPLGLPLLVGPASLSFVMAQSFSTAPAGGWWVVVPPLAVALLTYVTFELGIRLGSRISPTVMEVIEKLVGFLLAGLAIELIAAGARALFPVLGR